MAVTVMDRAASTLLVPAALLGRWERAMEDTQLWQFAPTVINGALGAESFLTANGDAAHEVAGLLGWQELRVGDPARDLSWLVAAGPDVVASALGAYGRANRTHDRLVADRAKLYAELDVARWLLHGTQLRSSEIVEDAVSMLSGIVDEIENDMMSGLAHGGRAS